MYDRASFLDNLARFNRKLLLGYARSPTNFDAAISLFCCVVCMILSPILVQRIDEGCYRLHACSLQSFALVSIGPIFNFRTNSDRINCSCVISPEQRRASSIHRRGKQRELIRISSPPPFFSARPWQFDGL